MPDTHTTDDYERIIGGSKEAQEARRAQRIEILRAQRPGLDTLRSEEVQDLHQTLRVEAAYFCAGQFVLSHFLDHSPPAWGLDIIPDFIGDDRHIDIPGTSSNPDADPTVLAAGPVAQAIRSFGGHIPDFDDFTDCPGLPSALAELVDETDDGDDEYPAAVVELYEQTLHRLIDHWGCVIIVAEGLLNSDEERLEVEEYCDAKKLRTPGEFREWIERQRWTQGLRVRAARLQSTFIPSE